ncbi:MAG: nucleotide sugar dehydrogenase [Candidatus Heimdallarchaeota archaeon]
MTSKVAVIGMGYVGIPIAALLADTGIFHVTGIQRRSKRSGWKIGYLNQGKCPIKNEPTLPEIIERVVTEKKTFTVTDDITVVKEMDFVLIDVQTPTDENNVPQYLSLKEVSKAVGEHMTPRSTVIIESTSAPGTTDYIVRPIIEEVSGLIAGKEFYLAYAYERVMVGRLIYNILNYPRIVGGINGESADKAAWLYKQVLKSQIIKTTALTAEFAKVVENTYRDVNVAFANEVALISESLGIDVYEVRKLVNNLPFIEGQGNPHRNMHIPGAGVGGHCLPKDPWLLKYGLTEYGKIPVQLDVIEASRSRNKGMPGHVHDLLIECMRETKRADPTGQKVAVLGVAFLENSDDPRNTPTRDFVKVLAAHKYPYAIHDPLVREEAVEFPISHDLEEVVRNSDAIVVLTAHQMYKDLDLSQIKTMMKQLPILIDGRTTFDPETVRSLGFVYRGLGRGQYR